MRSTLATLWSAEQRQYGFMTVRVGEIAPDFTFELAAGRTTLHAWLGDSWGVLFSHPADFVQGGDPGKWDKRNAKPLDFSSADDGIGRYGVDLADTTTRSVFIVGPDKRVKAVISYHPSGVHRLDDILRTVDSLQFTPVYRMTEGASRAIPDVS
jgi:thioredoxin-dependent peroxiredoxin